MAADGLLRPVYEACIAGGDSEIHRRPYHRNCGCALHKSRRNQPSHCSHSTSKSKSIAYPIRRAWSEGSLTLILASPPSSPVIGKSFLPPTADLSGDNDDDDDGGSPIQIIARN